MDVRSFKLLTGEEFVAELVAVTGRGYTIKNPLVVHVLRGQGGEGQLVFAPWSQVHARDVAIEIFASSICGEPVPLLEEVTNSYIQQMTGLVLPPTPGKQIILG